MGRYKDLMMNRDAFLELRDKIKDKLEEFPETSGGEIIAVTICPETGGLLVTAQHDCGQRTHRLIFENVQED
jgi:hypothetical protein